MIAIHSLLTENELADEFVAAFHARHFAEKFFYWFPLSVRAWLALCSDGAYRNYVRSRAPITSRPSPRTPKRRRDSSCCSATPLAPSTHSPPRASCARCCDRTTRSWWTVRFTPPSTP